MEGVEGVAGVLEGFCMAALFAVVGPDQGKGQKGEALAGQEDGAAEKLEFVAVAPKKFHVDIPQAQQLAQAAEQGVPAEKVEDKDGQDAGVVEVHHGHKAHDGTQHDGAAAYRNLAPEFLGCPCFFVPADQGQGDQKTPQHVLVDGVDQTAAHGQVEGKL